MYAKKQVSTILDKLERFQNMLHARMFCSVGTVEMRAFPTKKIYHAIPDKTNFQACEKGTIFQGERLYCWFTGEYVVSPELENSSLYIFPKVKGYEGMLWVNGHPCGNFTSRIIVDSHGNHYCDLLTKRAAKGERIGIALEYYSHHYVMGTQPFEKETEKFEICYDGVDICVKDEVVSDFYYDLLIAVQMARYLPEENLKRADVIRQLLKVNEIIDYDLEGVQAQHWRKNLEQAGEILKAMLQYKNAAHSGFAGLIGHSHMDTAWLWPLEETVKKCARTYANQLSLMEQYPNYTFIQSSALHTAMMEKYYPDIYEGMKRRIREGRYEPNGGVWVECDCNIPGGEYLIRQFLWGQRYTKEKFGYQADCFWLPDTFGYNASLPQIMKGCGIKYFLTTKLSWNDTNSFPYDTFYWEGIDRSRVFVHMNRTHIWPDPKMLLTCVNSNTQEGIKNKTVTDQRLLSYGFGDGGGGPEFEMIELADRLRDVEGLPRTKHVTVSQFMKRLEEECFHPSVYSGELYLELHRGTLTNQHQIKRNNRIAETALRNLEFITVSEAVEKDLPVSGERIRPLMSLLLLNQFHDILPGTCIPEVHDRALEQVGSAIRQAQDRMTELLADKEEKEYITLYNTLSFEREDVVYLPYHKNKKIADMELQQVTENMEGDACVVVGGVKLPAFAAGSFPVAEGEIVCDEKDAVFIMEGDVLETPYYRVVFDQNGYIDSLLDRKTGRELRGEGYALNTFLLAEDVPAAWDNWDIDADIADKWKNSPVLISRGVVSSGKVEFRIRSCYRLTEKSSLKQDMVFYSTSGEIVFFTEIDWQEDHCFLKTAFDTSVQSDFARHEIQFGCLERSTNRNTDLEKAKFEVCSHKYTDLSEPGYGVSLFNDCKYGISVEGSKMRLSLHKGGCRPDYRGDKGKHKCTYAFSPHASGFGAEAVIRPAYEFNIKPVVIEGKRERESFLTVDASNVLVETIKPLEAGDGYAIRLYEAEGTGTFADVMLRYPASRIVQSNMLEEGEKELGGGRHIRLWFTPFEIKTICVYPKKAEKENSGRRRDG